MQVLRHRRVRAEVDLLVDGADALALRLERAGRGDRAPVQFHGAGVGALDPGEQLDQRRLAGAVLDRKSTRLNSSHVKISYAVFCLKKKKKRGSIWTLMRSTHL